jgi:hypothetical protein
VNLAKVNGTTIKGSFDTRERKDPPGFYREISLTLSDGSTLRFTGVSKVERVPPTSCPNCGRPWEYS